MAKHPSSKADLADRLCDAVKHLAAERSSRSHGAQWIMLHDMARHLGISEHETNASRIDRDPAERRRQSGGTLSGGQQRLLSLAKVLVVPPKILVADELSLGLAPVIVDQVYEGLQEINRNGTALVVVEQQQRRRSSAGRHRERSLGLGSHGWGCPFESGIGSCSNSTEVRYPCARRCYTEPQGGGMPCQSGLSCDRSIPRTGGS